nr:hypothetical protein [Pandoravirus massiliensis]
MEFSSCFLTRGRARFEQACACVWSKPLFSFFIKHPHTHAQARPSSAVDLLRRPNPGNNDKKPTRKNSAGRVRVLFCFPNWRNAIVRFWLSVGFFACSAIKEKAKPCCGKGAQPFLWDLFSCLFFCSRRFVRFPDEPKGLWPASCRTEHDQGQNEKAWP